MKFPEEFLDKFHKKVPGALNSETFEEILQGMHSRASVATLKEISEKNLYRKFQNECFEKFLGKF